MKIKPRIALLFVITLSQLCGCEPEDERMTSSSTDKTEVSVSIVTKPVFECFLSTTDKDVFSLRVRFKTVGDTESNINATVYWKAYAQKTSSKSQKEDLTKVEHMRQYGSSVYHKSRSKKGMTYSIVFDKSHAG